VLYKPKPEDKNQQNQSSKAEGMKKLMSAFKDGVA
jgi:hypothetical protein